MGQQQQSAEYTLLLLLPARGEHEQQRQQDTDWCMEPQREGEEFERGQGTVLDTDQILIPGAYIHVLMWVQIRVGFLAQLSYWALASVLSISPRSFFFFQFYQAH